MEFRIRNKSEILRAPAAAIGMTIVICKKLPERKSINQSRNKKSFLQKFNFASVSISLSLQRDKKKKYFLDWISSGVPQKLKAQKVLFNLTRKYVLQNRSSSVLPSHFLRALRRTSRCHYYMY